VIPELVTPGSTTVGSFEERPLFFTSGSGALYGVFHPSVSSQSDFVLVFCHSLGIEHMVTQRMLVLGARAAAKSGFAAFRYDSRAHGDSTGDPKDITFTDLVDDACAAADYARKLSDARGVIWVGTRVGCLVAAEAIARRDDATALVLWEPFHKGSDYFQAAIRTRLFCNVAQGKSSGMTVDNLLQRLEGDTVVPVVGTYLYGPLWRSVQNIDLQSSLKTWSKATLIAQVQRRPIASSNNQGLQSAIEQRGGKVTIALINQEPSWNMLPLVRPQWTSNALLAASLDWLHGLE
jgi:pimeloyl-ACP methyl ester carboxylesterase